MKKNILIIAIIMLLSIYFIKKEIKDSNSTNSCDIFSIDEEKKYYYKVQQLLKEKNIIIYKSFENDEFKEAKSYWDIKFALSNIVLEIRYEKNKKDKEEKIKKILGNGNRKDLDSFLDVPFEYQKLILDKILKYENLDMCGLVEILTNAKL